jgi:hypothetical protein
MADLTDVGKHYTQERRFTTQALITTWHVALFTATPPTDGTFGSSKECADATYARMPLTSPTITGGVVENAAEITFPALTSGATIVGIGLASALTGGDLHSYHACTGSSVVVPAGQEFDIAINALTDTLT